MNTDRSAEGEELYAEKNSGERCVLDIYTYKNCIDFWIVRKTFISLSYTHIIHASIIIILWNYVKTLIICIFLYFCIRKC